MLLKNEILLQEFVEYHKDNEYIKLLSKEEVREIVYMPFKFVKKEMESNILPSVRLRYFGIFTIYLNRAKAMLRNVEKSYKENKISEKEYLRLRQMLTNYLNNY